MRNRYRKILLPVIMLVSILLLGGCGKQEQTHTVTFYVGKTAYATQQVTSAGTPEAVVPNIEGMQFAGWLDANGEKVNPEQMNITADIAFWAEAYPQMDQHVPYLFADENGFLCPDAPLTNRQMAEGLTAIATPTAKQYLPAMPEDDSSVTKQALTQTLKKLFAHDAVAQATQQITKDPVTRAAFATVINTLVDRSTEEPLMFGADDKMPLDLPSSHDAFADLMEASFPHSHDANGLSWMQTAAQTKRPSGFLNVDGWLYYVADDGCIVRDTDIGTLKFGADGRYTSGDSELDATVASVLDKIMQDNPDAARIDLMRRAFEYTRDSFTYRRRYDPYAMGQTGWEIEEAKAMFTNTKGNCYSFAAVFWSLARGLGYDAVAISGTMLKDHQPHGWVEIVMDDGEPYIFDPEMEYVYVHERDDHSHDMFMVSYTAGQWWNYRRA